MSPSERLSADLRGTGLTTGLHAMALIRQRLPEVWTALALREARNGERVTVAGMVICRQRPGTANVIVTPQLFEARRFVVTQEPFLRIRGIVQNNEGVIHVKALRIDILHADLSSSPSHDFH